MADDIASLGFQVDTSQLDQATAKVINFSAATTAASQATAAGFARVAASQASLNQATGQASSANQASVTSMNLLTQSIQNLTAAMFRAQQATGTGGGGGGGGGGAGGSGFIPRLNQIPRSAQLARYELLNLSRQIQDVGVGFASGQAPITIFLQQGSQIFDAFQTARLGGVSLTEQLLKLITPFRLLGVAIGAAALGGVLLASSWKSAALQLQDLSERTGVSAEKLSELQQAAAAKGVSGADLRQNIEAFSAEVDQARLGLGNLAVLFRVNGKSAGDLVQDLLQVSDLIKNAETGQKKWQLATEAGLRPTANLIRFLEQGSDAIKAALQNTVPLSSAQDELARKAQAFDDAWSKAFSDFGTKLKANTADALEKLGDLWDSAKSGFSSFTKTVQGYWTTLVQFMSDELDKHPILAKLLSGATFLTGFAGSMLQGIGTLTSGGASAPILPNTFDRRFQTTGTAQTSATDAAKITEYARQRAVQEGIIADETDKSAKNISKSGTDTRELTQREIQRISLLGDLATTTEKITQKRKELELAAAGGVSVDAKRRDILIQIAGLEDIARKAQQRVSVLGDSATAAEKYDAAVKDLNVNVAKTIITQSDMNRKLLDLDPILGSLSQNSSNFLNTFVEGILSGVDAVTALANALKSLGSSITRNAINNLGADITKSISGIGGTGLSNLLSGLPGIGSTLGAAGGPLGSLLGAGIGVGVSLIGGLFTKSSQAQQEQAQAAQQLASASDSASQSLQGVIKSFNDLTKVAEGPVSSAIENASAQFQQLRAQAQGSQTAAISSFFAPGATPGQQASAVIAFTQAQQAIGNASSQLDQFNQRTIETARAALRGKDSLSDIAQQMQNLRDQAEDINAAMRKLGVSEEDARRAVEDDLIVALQRLRATVTNDLTKQLNQLQGKGWINDMADLFKTIADAQTLGVDPGLVQNFLIAKSQDIVNSAKLTGVAFDNFIAMFPQLTGAVTQFTEAAVAAAQTITSTDLVRQINTLQGKSFLNDMSDLVDTVAAAQASGIDPGLVAQFVQLKAQDIVNSASLVGDAFTELTKLFPDLTAGVHQAVIDITGEIKTIQDYLNSLITGPSSALSPSAKLAAAQQLFNSQLALAQIGNLDALKGITQVADTYRQALQDVFGSSIGFQTGLANIQSGLGGLLGLGSATASTSAASLAQSPSATTPFASLAAANDNVVSVLQDMSNTLSGLLQRIADLEEQANDKLDENTQAIKDETSAITRETRFARRSA